MCVVMPWRLRSLENAPVKRFVLIAGNLPVAKRVMIITMAPYPNQCGVSVHPKKPKQETKWQ